MKISLNSNPDKDVYTVGKATDNDIVIVDMSVSRKHGVFTKQPDGSWLYQDTSKNGTTILTPSSIGVYVHNRTIRIKTPCQLLLGASVLEVTA